MAPGWTEFQSTLPQGERLGVAGELNLPEVTFQSTLPQGERHYFASEYRARLDISIHAPARGAT